MAKQLEEYLLTLGEKRDGMNYTARTYFFYQTATDIEMGLSKCPYVKILWSRGGNANEITGTRISEMCFSISQPIVVKMVCMHTGFGLPTNRKFIYIDLNPAYEKLQIIGLGNFGEFVGHGKINAEKSGMTMEVIRKNFTINVMSAPALQSTTETRSLIF